MALPLLALRAGVVLHCPCLRCGLVSLAIKHVADCVFQAFLVADVALAPALRPPFFSIALIPGSLVLF